MNSDLQSKLNLDLHRSSRSDSTAPDSEAGPRSLQYVSYPWIRIASRMPNTRTLNIKQQILDRLSEPSNKNGLL